MNFTRKQMEFYAGLYNQLARMTDETWINPGFIAACFEDCLALELRLNKENEEEEGGDEEVEE